MRDTALPDITTPADIDRLIAAFYARVLPDPIIGFFFTAITQVDLAPHLQTISAFWQQQLLGNANPDTARYRGELFAVHRDLHQQAALTADHFHRWLLLFRQTLDELFSGPRAEAAKQRASRIANSMQTALATRHPRATEASDGALQWFEPDAI
jgi:hemoglobin